MRFVKDLNAQLYALCNLTAAEVKYVEKASQTWTPRVHGGKHRWIEVVFILSKIKMLECVRAENNENTCK